MSYSNKLTLLLKTQCYFLLDINDPLNSMKRIRNADNCVILTVITCIGYSLFQIIIM